MRGIWQPQIRGHSCQLQHIIVINLLNNLDERVNLFSLWKTGINWIQINSFIAKGEFDQTKKTSKSWTKPKGETTQMKGLDEYFVMAVFTLLLNRVCVFANFMFNLNQRNMAMKGLKRSVKSTVKLVSFCILWEKYWANRAGQATDCSMDD